MISLIWKPMSLNQTPKLKPLYILKVTLESEFQYLGDEAFLDTLLFVKKSLLWVFIQAVKFCRNLFVTPCAYTLYLYAHI